MARLIWSKIEQLAMNPHAPNNNVKRLKGQPRGQETFRLRVGDWRVLYALEDTRLVVLVLKIRPRSSAYD